MIGPYTLRNLEGGKEYLWCSCGKSKTQPFCDGSHVGSAFKPLRWTCPEVNQTVYSLCGCKYTQSPPFCDGNHIHVFPDEKRSVCHGKHRQLSW